MLQPPVALRASFSGKDGGVSIVSAPDSVYNVGSLPLAKRILTYFAAKGSPVSISMVSENMTDVSASSVKARMADLEREGQIARVERGLYVLASKAPTPYYAVEREGEEEIDTEKAFSMGG
jgi:hypothetical protein